MIKTIGNPVYYHKERTWKNKEKTLIIWLLSFQKENKIGLQMHFGMKKDLWNTSLDRNISEHCTSL